MWRKLAPFVLVITLAWAGGCSDNGSDPAAGSGTVRIHLTDAPSDYLASAQILVSHVYLQAAEEDSTLQEETEGEPSVDRVDLYGPDAEPLAFELLDLQNGVEGFLAEVLVPAGDYHQLRLVVDEANVTLRDGYMFSDSSTVQELKTPSAHQSGIKVKLSQPIAVEEGMLTLVVVDMDVDQNFKFQGNPETPAGLHGVLFTPSLTEARRETAEDN